MPFIYGINSNRTGGTEQKRRCPFKEEVGIQNLKEYDRVVAADGKMKSKTAIKLENQAKFGTPEYHKRLSERSKKMHKEGRGNIDPQFWKGKKQNPEHLEKRMRAIHGEDWQPKA